MPRASLLREDDEVLLKVIGLYKVRIKMLSEFTPMTDHFFSNTCCRVEEKGVEKHLTPPQSRRILSNFAVQPVSRFFRMQRFDRSAASWREANGLKAGAISHPTRVTMSRKDDRRGCIDIVLCRRLFRFQPARPLHFLIFLLQMTLYVDPQADFYDIPF